MFRDLLTPLALFLVPLVFASDTAPSPEAPLTGDEVKHAREDVAASQKRVDDLRRLMEECMQEPPHPPAPAAAPVPAPVAPVPSMMGVTLLDTGAKR